MANKKTKFNIDFVGKRKIFVIFSITLIVLSGLSTLLGVNTSIEFKGGTILTYEYSGDIDLDKLDEIISSRINSDFKLQEGTSFENGKKNISISFTGGGTYTGAVIESDGTASDGTEVNMSENFNAAQQSELTNTLTETFPDSDFALLDSNNVNPSSGKTFFWKCLVAVGFASIILILFIAIRFRTISGWFAGVCAITALLHDIIITFGIFVALRFQIDTNFMAVILTIIGYSINDTIVIYDRIRENRKLHKKMGITELVNLSINQSMSRCINTSVTTVAMMLIITIVCLAMGVTTILSLSVPLMFGLTIGTYSSACLAPTLWVMVEGKDELKKA